MKNELVTTNFKSVRELFEGAQIQGQLQRAVPQMIKVEQLVRVSLTVIRQAPKLLQCSQESLLNCLMGCASLGLSPEPFLGQAYFVPFWNKNLGCFESVFMPGYRGYVTLAKRSGELNSLSAQMVYMNDQFDIQWGLNEKCDHVPADGDRGEHRGAWTVFKYKSGDPTFDYMPLSDIDIIMNRTKSKNKQGVIFGPWLTDKAEMSKKTIIRRHMKLAPLSVEDNRLMQAAHAENLALDGSQSGFFLPDDPPIEIELDPDETLDAFREEFDTGPDDAMMGKWVTHVADTNGISEDKAMAEALKEPAEFSGAFDIWKAKQGKPADPEKEKPDNEKKTAPGNSRYPDQDATEQKKQTESGGMSEKDTVFMNTWYRLKSGFKQFVLDNTAEFAQAGTMLQGVAKKKWAKQFPNDMWPLQRAGDDDPGPGFIDSDEYKALMELRERFPAEYLKQAGDKEPTTISECVDLVNAIEEAVDS